MTVSEAQKRATTKWEAKTYDRILLRMPKGKRDRIKAAADAEGKSVNGFIMDLIDRAIHYDNTK